LWLILALPFAARLVRLLFGSRFSGGSAATVRAVLLLFILTVLVAVLMALALKIYRRYRSRPWARRKMRE